MKRRETITAFLVRHGYAAEQLRPLAQDASYRQYWRLLGGPRPAVLMDAPPPEDISAFLRLDAHLAGIGLSVPAIFAADQAAGLLLEEDFGDTLLPHILTAANTQEIFDAAVDALVVLHCAPPPAGLPAWGAPEMAATATATMLDWWWPAMFGAPAPDAARHQLAMALATMLAPLAGAGAAPTLVHRDYFAGNLLWLADREGVRRIGVLDFQSAALGHPAYDLASLIQDARRDISPALAARASARYLTARPELDGQEFRVAVALCAAQRHLRVCGQWVRLARRDGKPHYLAHGPRSWALLHAALQAPATAPLAAWMDRWIPSRHRANPPDAPP